MTAATPAPAPDAVPGAASAARALARWAAEAPYDPAIFYPRQDGFWRWRSWSWLGARVAEVASGLTGGATTAAEVVTYPWQPEPRALVADLAIQSAGRFATPLGNGEGQEPAGAAAWTGAHPLALPELGDLEGNLLGREPTTAPAPPVGEGGGALVHDGSGWQRWHATELRRASSAVAACVAPTPAGRRRIALLGPHLAAPAERAFLAWALDAGAALVLAGDASLLAWSLAWTRPTDACLPAELLTETRLLLSSLGRPRTVRRRLRRLPRLLVHGEVDDDERAAWAELGVELRGVAGGPGPTGAAP